MVDALARPTAITRTTNQHREPGGPDFGGEENRRTKEDWGKQRRGDEDPAIAGVEAGLSLFWCGRLSRGRRPAALLGLCGACPLGVRSEGGGMTMTRT